MINKILLSSIPFVISFAAKIVLKELDKELDKKDISFKDIDFVDEYIIEDYKII
ncbi:hypothetical protein [Brachyspira intermedia]|uniref:hypothetical protein n=1 Tax=Brachyspira intermedia TaxID=84377 RepID=UPI0030075607